MPIAGLHKFYVGQPWWGLVYLLLSGTLIPHVASAIEGVWYLVQQEEAFRQRFDGPDPLLSWLRFPAWGQKSGEDEGKSKETGPITDRVEEVAEALRQLEQLRQEGLISDQEWEQKRRQWLDRI